MTTPETKPKIDPKNSRPYFPPRAPVVLPRYPTEKALNATAKILAAREASQATRDKRRIGHQPSSRS